MLLGDDGDAGGGQDDAGVDRGDRDAQPLAPLEELLPAVAAGHVESAAVQQVDDVLATPGRIRGEQHASVEAVEEVHQGGGGVLEARLHPECRRQAGGQVELPRRVLHRLRRVADRGEPGEAVVQGSGLVEAFLRPEHGPLGIEAVELVTLADLRPGAVEDRRQVRRRQHEGVLRQVVRQHRGGIEEQRQEVFDATVVYALRDVPVDAG